jgi:hypothetical protein
MKTQKQRKAIKNVVENGGNVSKAMRDAGYSPKTAKNPKKLTDSKTWKELMEEYLPEKDLAKVHRGLLNAHHIEHMVFPLGPKEKTLPPVELEPQEHGGALKREHKQQESLKLTDEQIIELLESVNCTVRKIAHGDTARHVWFWSPDNKAKKDALDMAYKLRGNYAPEKKDLTSQGEKIGVVILPQKNGDTLATDNQTK